MNWTDPFASGTFNSGQGGGTSPTFEVNAFGVTDAATGIDPNTITYTHAVDFNAAGHPANINGLAFYNDTNRSGPGYNLVNPPNSFTGFNSPASNSSQLEGLMARFWYGDTDPTLTLTGLTPGKRYKVRFFIGGYGGPNFRRSVPTRASPKLAWIVA